MDHFLSMTLTNLREIAKEKGIKNVTTYKKEELCILLKDMEKENGGVKQEPQAEETAKKPIFDIRTEKVNVDGVLEVMFDGYGFVRGGKKAEEKSDVYVPANLIRRYNLKTGDNLEGFAVMRDGERFEALIYITGVNGDRPDQVKMRVPFEKLVPIYPMERLVLEQNRSDYATRLIDLVSPLGKGQRGLIVAPPKTGKTTLLKKIAHSITEKYPDVKTFVLLIDERPEEVTDMIESLPKAEVISSTFDMTPENHTKVAELTMERAQRLVEHGKDVVILLDSITRLARAYNMTVQASGRTLSGGLEAGALHPSKKFFGAARNIKDGGSLTILATALVETGSRMDDVIFEEFKGTGNMELHLDRAMSERRVFPAIDLHKSGTRKEELLLDYEEMTAIWNIRRAFGSFHPMEVTEYLLGKLIPTKTNAEFVEVINKSIKDDFGGKRKKTV